MYAIRSYYVEGYATGVVENWRLQKAKESGIPDIQAQIGGVEIQPRYWFNAELRITSYNVCYTKLLRKAGRVLQWDGA